MSEVHVPDSLIKYLLASLTAPGLNPSRMAHGAAHLQAEMHCNLSQWIHWPSLMSFIYSYLVFRSDKAIDIEINGECFDNIEEM